MFSTNLFELTSGATAPAVLADMPAVLDPSVTLNNNRHIIFQQAIQLQLVYAFGQADITQVQFQTPKLRPIALPSIRPFDIGTTPTTRPPICNYSRSPLMLNAIDENSMQLSAGTFTSGDSYYAGCWFSDGNVSVAQGMVYSVNFTASISAVAGAWANGPIILAQTLPAGTYTVVGMDAWGTNMAFARLIFPNQQWRPGILAGGTAGFINAPCFRNGQLGNYGSFLSYAQPQLDVFAIGSNSAQSGVLDLIKTG